MKKTISTLLALLFVAAVFTNCEKDKEDNTPLLVLLLAADQLGGNCATITRQSTTSYSATITVVPKGACKVNQTKAEAVTSAETSKTTILGFYTRAGASCDATKTTVTTLLDNDINTTKNKTDAAYAEDVAKLRALSVGSLIVETTAKLKNDGRTDAQIAAMSLGTIDDLGLYSAAEYARILTQTACQNAVKALNQASADAIFSNPPTKLVTSSCTYGSSAAAGTKCATLNLEF
ncbi:hypothetical protein P3G55_12245 [Leptospira sp. 96542]|nr:hypothetical protein [Leptospira sp. 96542]